MREAPPTPVKPTIIPTKKLKKGNNKKSILLSLPGVL
jgi:hypothetical protein